MWLRGWARSRGIASSTAHKAAQAGRLDRYPDGSVDAEVADRQWMERTRLRIDSPIPRGVEVVAVDADTLDAAVDEFVGHLLLGSPDAQGRIKRLLDAVTSGSLADACGLGPGFIADARASAEGQEGMRAFLEKRKPDWHPEAS